MFFEKIAKFFAINWPNREHSIDPLDFDTCSRRSLVGRWYYLVRGVTFTKGPSHLFHVGKYYCTFAICKLKNQNI
jgi:hypothetical protein